uniref:Uncharacterized protein n=1 Tax=Romanomermis culicivorax TaxID=13658 RepID=A0A915LC09_ROMCU
MYYRAQTGLSECLPSPIFNMMLISFYSTKSVDFREKKFTAFSIASGVILITGSELLNQILLYLISYLVNKAAGKRRLAKMNNKRRQVYWFDLENRLRSSFVYTKPISVNAQCGHSSVRWCEMRTKPEEEETSGLQKQQNNGRKVVMKRESLFFRLQLLTINDINTN